MMELSTALLLGLASKKPPKFLWRHAHIGKDARQGLGPKVFAGMHRNYYPSLVFLSVVNSMAPFWWSKTNPSLVATRTTSLALAAGSFGVKRQPQPA